MTNVFSESSGIEVEHILPRRCNDNSFSNKVLAHRACNVRKADRTPRQAWDPSPEWDKMLNFVNGLRDKKKDKALHDRFIIQTESELQAFTNLHLSDTRYISKLASEYVELLYGGRDAQLDWDDRVRRCVYASSGALTAEMRKRWGLNAILKPKPANTETTRKETKSRDDHRHHAVDAIVIALTTESTIKRAAFETQRHDRASGHLLPRYFPPPWPANGEIEERISSFRGEVRQAVEKIKVSHRVNHTLNGKLNEDTFYGSPKPDGEVARITKFVHKLTDADIKNLDLLIEDRIVREAIRAQLQRFGNDPKNLEGNLPYLERKDGTGTPIRKVRLAKRGLTLETLRHGAVLNAENHHIVIFKQTDPVAGELWYTPGPVTRLKAMRDRAQEAKRIAPQKGPYEIVAKKDGEGSTYMMYLMKGDAVEMLDPVNDLRDIYIFSSMSDGDYVFLRHSAVVSSAKKAGLTLSQLRSEMQRSGDRVRTRLDRLREWECKKVILDPLGKVIYQHDRPHR